MVTWSAEYGASLRVPRAALDMDQVYRDLRIRNKGYEYVSMMGWARESQTEYVEMWEEDEGWVILPRGYEPPLYGVDALEYIDVRPEWEQSDWPAFRKELRENQHAPWSAIKEHYGDKLLCLGTGKGKTELALKYAGYCAVPTLILVDRVGLGTNWLDRICGTGEKACDTHVRTFTGPHSACDGRCERAFDLEPEQIGWVQSNKFSIGAQFTIALAHTLVSRMWEIPAWFWDHFGLVILDEAHAMAADSFSALAPLFSGERLLLTATPDRNDGLDPLVRYHGGGITPVFTDISVQRSATWTFKSMPSLLTPDQEGRCYRWINRRGREVSEGSEEEITRVFKRPEYLTWASQCPQFSDYIIGDILDAISSGHRCLVLGNRVEQMLMIADVLRVVHGLKAQCVNKDTKDEKRTQYYRDCDVILATGGTTGIAGKGVDFKVSALFILAPHDDEGVLRQEAGRCGREENSPEPIITVYCHDAQPSMKFKSTPMIENVQRMDPNALIYKEKVEW